MATRDQSTWPGVRARVRVRVRVRGRGRDRDLRSAAARASRVGKCRYKGVEWW